MSRLSTKQRRARTRRRAAHHLNAWAAFQGDSILMLDLIWAGFSSARGLGRQWKADPAADRFVRVS